MFKINRLNFIAWVNGVLMDRNDKGEIIVGDKPEHEEAEKRMLDGETIGLTSGGKIITYMHLTPDGFEEFLSLETEGGSDG